MVCNLHFRPQDIVKKKLKYFVNSNAVPLKWANDHRNIHRNDEKDDSVNRILDESEIKIESEQISYANNSEIYFKPKIEKEIVPDTSEILEALKSKNEENIKLQRTNQQLRKEIKCLRLKLQRRNKKISTLKAKLKKDKSNKNAKTIPSSPESTESSTEEFVEVNELEELDESNDSLNLDLHQGIDST
uniref:Uncharacterized protein n=1 Tax=Phlebotomus papatasi TaxID=29031 RepID=A0A1B0DH60_PHLPP